MDIGKDICLCIVSSMFCFCGVSGGGWQLLVFLFGVPYMLGNS
jgi:hypothetical protein